MPKVSIGLPVYNGENFVRYAIESVLNQTFQDWELVISDNASVDATEAVCRHYAEQDPRIKYLRSEVNRGAAWNFNEVFHRSTGEYFRWLSHDDYIMPSLIEKSVAVLDDSPEFISCASETGAIDEHGFRILDDVANECDLACQGLTEESEKLRLQYSKCNAASGRYLGILLHSRRCNEVYGLIRREVMAKTQLHPPYCGGEKVLLAEITLRGKIYEIPEMLFYVRWHTERFTANNSTKEQDAHMATEGRPVFSLPHQYRATLGYLGLLQRVPMPVLERGRCLMNLARFVTQFSKWGSILKNTLAGKATWAEIDGATKSGPVIHETIPLPSSKELSASGR